jgi:hypothetical protein
LEEKNHRLLWASNQQTKTPGRNRGFLFLQRGALLLLAALSALLPALTRLLVRLLGLLVRLVLATALLSALTGLLARLLVLLSALILIILSHRYLQLECELSRYGQLPGGVRCSFRRNIKNLCPMPPHQPKLSSVAQ